MARFDDLDRLAIDTLRTLAIDAIEAARSGHPGAPLGLAPLGWLLFRAESLPQALHLLSAIAFDLRFDPAALAVLGDLALYSGILVAVQTAQFFADEHFLVPRLPLVFQGAVFGVLFYLVAIYGAVSDAFIYFQF